MEEIYLREEYIKLGQALKAANVVESGVLAKFVIQDKLVKVNGEIETRRGKKLKAGDFIEFNNDKILIRRKK
jgi:ribosome-associated protein